MLDNIAPPEESVETKEFFYSQKAAIPRFSSPVHVGCPNVMNREKFFARVNDIFDRKWLTNNGIYVQELEQKIANYLKVEHCVLVANATVALDILGRAIGLSGEVIVPAFTFVATAHSLLWQNLKPVFCDIDPTTHNLDPEEVQKLITPETSAILGVHIWGRPCAVQELEQIAKTNNLKLIYDAAHAFGCSAGDTMIGNFGIAEVFSFHATKLFNTFEGGAITTNNAELAEKLRLMRNFGFQELDQVVSLGTNAKLSEVAAAMGLTNLESIDFIIERNRENYLNYQSQLSKIPGISVIEYDPANQNNFQYVIIEVDSAVSGFSREELVHFLHSHNVLVRRYFYPGCHNMEPYRSSDFRRGVLDHTEKLNQQVVSFPTGTSITSEHICAIAGLIAELHQDRTRVIL